MAETVRSPRHETLYGQLRLLARDRGVWRDDLAELLDTEPCDLRDFWEIDTDSNRPIDRLRADVSSKLKQHLDSIPARPARRAKWRGKERTNFTTVLYLLFNLLNRDHGNMPARIGKLRISSSAFGRELRFACHEIAEQILATGYEPKMVAKPEPDDDPEQLEESPPSSVTGVVDGELVKARPRELVAYRRPHGLLARQVNDDHSERSASRDRSFAAVPLSRSRRRLVILAAVALLLVIGGGLVWWQPWRTASGAAAQAGAGAVPSTDGRGKAVTPSTPAEPLPFRIDSVAHLPTSGAGYTYAFRDKLQLTSADLGSLTANEMGSREYRGWMLDRGGVATNDNATQIVLRGTLPQAVVISKLRLIKKCEPYLTGALMYSPGAGQDDSVQIGFDLDKSPSMAETYERGSLNGGYFAEYTVELAQGETKTLVVHAVTYQQYCEYHLELDVTTGQGAQPTIVKIDDNGEPFKVSAAPGFSDSVSQFADYQELYAGGVASVDGWAQEEPKTYAG